MLKIYDKAQWHIDAGESVELCVNRIKIVFEFLNKKGMLTSDGIEMLDIGIDSSVSLNERMVSEQGKIFLEQFYDDILQLSLEDVKSGLEERYMMFFNIKS